jgi:hypothetical protein
MKKIVIIILLVFFCWAINKAYVVYTGDFRIGNIRYEETLFQPKSITIPLDEAKLKHIKTVLDQAFQFIGQGNQAYAFLSADSKYVLKFFKFGHLKKNPLWNFLPKLEILTDSLKEKNLSQQKRFMKVFDGYLIAYEDDPENTGVIFIHLNKTNSLNQSVIVSDRLGFTHTIDLDDVVFVLQEKVTPTKQVLTELLEKQDVRNAKIRIGQLFTLYLSEYKKGIFDRDHNLIYNTGFNEHAAIRLDVGKLRKNEEVKKPEFYMSDLKKIAYKRIDRWLHTYYPKFQKEIADYMESRLGEISDEK